MLRADSPPSSERSEPWRAALPLGQIKASRNGNVRRRYLARRLEILRAAGREFRRRGFAETGMRDIAAAAALSPANLYNYFHGKHELLYFCQDSSLDRMMAALDQARRRKTSAARRLRLVLVSHLRCLLDEVEGSAAHLLTCALPARQQHSLVVKRDRYERGLRNLLVAGMASGEFVPADAALVARAMLGALNWSVQWFHPEGPLTAAEIAETLADYLIRGLLAKPCRSLGTRTEREETPALPEGLPLPARKQGRAKEVS